MTAGKSLGAIEAYAKDERDGLPARWWLYGLEAMEDAWQHLPSLAAALRGGGDA